jgi:hypothetical protein
MMHVLDKPGTTTSVSVAGEEGNKEITPKQQKMNHIR